MPVTLNGSTSGQVTLTAPAVAGTTTLTLPASTGNVVVDVATQTLTNKTLTSPTINSPVMGGSVITPSTAQASTSGTEILFTGIPSWARRITAIFSGVSTNGTSNVQLQIGSGSIETSGYTATAGTGGSQSTATSGFLLTSTLAASDTLSGSVSIYLITGSTYVSSGVLAASSLRISTGTKAASAVIDRLRITTVNGTDTFDAGIINIFYE